MRFRLGSVLAVATVVAFGLPAVALGFAAPATFSSTGAEQSYTVPGGVMLEGVLVQGASGGSNNAQPGYPTDQVGAALQGYLQTTPGQTLYTEVGQNGTAGGGATFGGGGAAGSGGSGNVCNGLPCDGAVAGSGGGASDVRTCSMSATSCPGGGSSLDSRLIVAAAAGGDGGQSGGAQCENTYTLLAPGRGQNNQLPVANPSGPAAITTSAGTVIPGFAGGGQASVLTINGTTNAGMGTTVAGAGGSQSGCTVNNQTYSAFASGSAGSGPDGGAGGNSSASTGAGGGGGGYFGGGGGASGSSVCSPTPCSPVNSAEGGGAGSSFVANAIEYPTFTFPATSGVVFIEYWPVIEIDTPANGAVYSPGQVVDASWDCASYSSGPGGCDSSSGTVPSGTPIDTAPGTHTFTVNGKVNVTGNGSQPVSATITYTVNPVGGPGGGTTPAAKTVRAVISSKHHSAKFTFSAAGATGFQCALSHKPKGKHKMIKPNYSSCTSPKTYKHLKVGRYTFFVRAVSHGIVGTAASKSFKIG